MELALKIFLFAVLVIVTLLVILPSFFEKPNSKEDAIAEGMQHELGSKVTTTFETKEERAAKLLREQRRYELAKAAMQGLLANSHQANTYFVRIASNSFDMADAMLAHIDEPAKQEKGGDGGR